MSKLLSITECTDLAGKRVLLRSALNAPVEAGVVTDTFRLDKGLATTQFLIEAGAKVILVSHISNDKKTEAQESIAPVHVALQKSFPVRLVSDIVGQATKQAVSDLQDGAVLLLENLRQNPGEKANEEEFAQALASLADIYVNDDFPVAHREHASIVGVPKYLPAYAGLQFMAEYEALSTTLTPAHPSLFILGGAKFDTKLPLVEKMLDTYDQIFVGGALANDFFKAKGYEVGTSLVSEIDLSASPLLTNEKIILPVDVTVSDGTNTRVTTPDQVLPNESILDAGPATLEQLKTSITQAKTVLWNGPLGNYEGGYGEQTEALARVIAEAEGYSVVGGGDTVAALHKLGIMDQFDFVSTAGGAMLTFLEAGTLPAIEALEK